MSRAYRRALVFAAISLGLVVPAHAQSRAYAGAALSFVTHTPGATPERLGGTTWGGSAVLGVHVTRRLSVEFEPTFTGETSAQTYTYRPSPSLLAEVAARGRDTFYTGQLRVRAGILEPVAGVSYVRSTIRRHAVLVPGDQTYFDDESSRGEIALAAGLDAAFRLSPRFALVPTFRVFVVPRDTPLRPGSPGSGQSVVFRAGVGGRVTF